MKRRCTGSGAIKSDSIVTAPRSARDPSGPKAHKDNAGSPSTDTSAYPSGKVVIDPSASSASAVRTAWTPRRSRIRDGIVVNVAPVSTKASTSALRPVTGFLTVIRYGKVPIRLFYPSTGRFGTSTERLNFMTTSPRWFVARVSTVTTPRSGRDSEARASSTSVSA